MRLNGITSHISGLIVLAAACLLLSETAVIAAARKTADSADSISVKIYYRLDKYAIDPAYMGNKSSLQLIDSLFSSRRRKIDSIRIFSSASPEGSVPYNGKLSLDRGKALMSHIAGMQHAQKGITIIPLGSNFPEFIDALRNDSRIPHRNDIVNEFVCHPQENPDITYRRIMKFNDGVPYTYIKRYTLPYLRYATVTVFSQPSLQPLQLPETKALTPARPAADYGEQYSGIPVRNTGTASEGNGTHKSRHWYPALKTNLLYDAVTALNAEMEFPISRKFSILVEDVFPWWKGGTNDKKYCLQIWSMGIEPRWWFRRNDKRDWLSGHFAGAYAMSGKYDLQWKTRPCYQGEYWSAGLTYGYAMPVCRWLNMEFSVSAGYVRSDYRHYMPDEDYGHLFRDKFNIGTSSWFGPTKVKVSLVLPLGKDSHNKHFKTDSRN